ncbi:MAG: L-ribulose-5-phosphate 3-epimerase, partial [Planctomycetaceae bacterium]
MRDTSALSRRQFVQLAAVAAASRPLLARAEESSEGYLNGRLYKTLKIGMVRTGKSFEEKFAIAKEAGFDGIELNCPGINVEEVRAAIKATGLPVDGSVNAGHWAVRHTDADAATRAKALDSLKEALRQTHAVGGNSVLLVVGKGSDGPEEEIWKRSVENISKALP